MAPTASTRRAKSWSVMKISWSHRVVVDVCFSVGTWVGAFGKMFLVTTGYMFLTTGFLLWRLNIHKIFTKKHPNISKGRSWWGALTTHVFILIIYTYIYTYFAQECSYFALPIWSWRIPVSLSREWTIHQHVKNLLIKQKPNTNIICLCGWHALIAISFYQFTNILPLFWPEARGSWKRKSETQRNADDFNEWSVHHCFTFLSLQIKSDKVAHVWWITP